MDTSAQRETTPGRPPSGRQPIFNISGVVLGLILICIGVHAARSYLLSPEQDFAVILYAAFIPARYGGAVAFDVFAFTTPVTYAFLHGGGAHLAINVIWLATFGSPLAMRLGPARILAFWVVTSATAAAAHYFLYPQSFTPLVGASGAISGMMGAAARFGFRTDPSNPIRAFSGPVLTIAEILSSRTVLSFLIIWMVVNLVSGLGFLSPSGVSSIAWEAHIGGFVVGFFGIGLFKGNR